MLADRRHSFNTQHWNNMTEKPHRMRIDDKGIGAVLSRGPTLAVPPNQREYKWTDEHVTDLFEDLQKSIDGNQSTYFLGAIALTGADPDKPQVTDGQQRLATTTILLAAMRDYFHERGNTFKADHIDREYLTISDPEEDRLVPRLTLNVDDREYFAKQVATRPGDPARDDKPNGRSNERIQAACRLAAKRVQTIIEGYNKEADRAKRLLHWVKFITNDALVVVLELPSDLNAFRMFETLNDRGLRTTQVDIVKNYLFEQAKENATAVQPKWSRMIGILESLDDGDEVPINFLRHYVITKLGMTRAGEVFEKIEGIASGKHRALEIVSDMEENANDYAAILSPDHRKWNTYPPGIRHSIRTMLYLGVKPARPLLLAVARHFAPKEVDSAFRLFVRWTVRFLIVGGGRSGTLEDGYAEAALLVAGKKIKDAKELAKKLLPVIPADALFREAFATASVNKNSLARYYLRALEMKHKGSAEPEWVPNDNASDVNLEHVLPENPGENWPKMPSDLAAALYTRLGNLALLQTAKNSDLGNKSFGGTCLP